MARASQLVPADPSVELLPVIGSDQESSSCVIEDTYHVSVVGSPPAALAVARFDAEGSSGGIDREVSAGGIKLEGNLGQLGQHDRVKPPVHSNGLQFAAGSV